MGRPRKRQKTDHIEHRPTEGRSELPPAPPEPVIDPELTERFNERSNFENVCTGPIAQTIKRANKNKDTNSTDLTLQNSGSGSARTSPYDQPQTPPDNLPIPSVSYPTDAALWPDFSEMTMLPMLMQDGHKKDHTIPFDPSSNDDAPYSYDPQADPSTLLNLPSIPECPCLPNSYLTLSTLSTLSAFPVSSGTIGTLLSAHRTAKASLFCTVCPQKFQAGSQNVMFSSVMINVMADHWHRVRKASAEELRRGFGVGDDNPSVATSGEDNATLSPEQELEWRLFGYNLIRAHVFGDAPVPIPPDSPQRRNPPTPTGSTLTLMSVFTSFERRQKQWHNQEQWTGEFPQRFTRELESGYTAGMTMEEITRCQDKSHRETGEHDHLCLRIVDTAKRVVLTLDTEPPS